jgi:hypothetical protein
MSHLHPERLAALADVEPTAAEAAHLSSCSACAYEMAAHRHLLMLAWRERETLSAPLASWDTIAGALREEGLIRDALAGAPQIAGRASGARSPWWLQAAAAVVLLAGGMAIGRLAVPPVGGSETATTGDARVPSGQGDVRVASDTITFNSTAEAFAALERAERDYLLAMMYLSGQDTVTRVADDPAIYRARLAALDEMAGVALDAVHQAPQDPLMNRYYLSTLGARNVTLRQLGEKLPQNVQLAAF